MLRHFRRLLSAAVRTLSITKLPQLAQHATEGCPADIPRVDLFNAAVVTVVIAYLHQPTD